MSCGGEIVFLMLVFLWVCRQYIVSFVVLGICMGLIFQGGGGGWHGVIAFFGIVLVSN